MTVWLRVLFVFLAALGGLRPLAAQDCRAAANVDAAEVCLLEAVRDLRFEIEESFHAYTELLPASEARMAQVSHDRWERYLDDECRDAGERYRGGAPVLVEMLYCEQWGMHQRVLQLRLLTSALRGGDFVYDPQCFVPTSDLVVLSGALREHAGTEYTSVATLQLDRPLCVDLGTGAQVVGAVQLVGLVPGLGRRARRLFGARATVEGRLFLPHLPSHRTPLVLVVQGLDREP